MALITLGVGFGVMIGAGIFLLLIRPALKERAEAEAARDAALSKKEAALSIKQAAGASTKQAAGASTKEAALSTKDAAGASKGPQDP